MRGGDAISRESGFSSCNCAKGDKDGEGRQLNRPSRCPPKAGREAGQVPGSHRPLRRSSDTSSTRPTRRLAP